MEQLPPVLLALVGNALGHDAFHREARLRRVAAGGEWPITLGQETVLGEPALRLSEHDVRRNQAACRGSLTLEQGYHRSGAGVDQPLARLPAGLHRVGSGFVGVDAVGHAADDGVLVGLIRQQRHQLVDFEAGGFGRDRLIERAAVIVAGRGFGIEGVGVRRAAPHPDLDYRLGFAFGFSLGQPRIGPEGNTGPGHEQAARTQQTQCVAPGKLQDRSSIHIVFRL